MWFIRIIRVYIIYCWRIPSCCIIPWATLVCLYCGEHWAHIVAVLTVEFVVGNLSTIVLLHSRMLGVLNSVHVITYIGVCVCPCWCRSWVSRPKGWLVCSQQVWHWEGWKLWLLLGYNCSYTCEPYTTDGESIRIHCLCNFLSRHFPVFSTDCTANASHLEVTEWGFMGPWALGGYFDSVTHVHTHLSHLMGLASPHADEYPYCTEGAMRVGRWGWCPRSQLGHQSRCLLLAQPQTGDHVASSEYKYACVCACVHECVCMIL